MAVEYTETLDTILKDTIPQLPGAVRAVAERELRLTMREFFERSYAWREMLVDVDAPAGETPILLDSTLTGDANADVIGIIAVWHSGRRIGPIPYRPGRAGDYTSDIPTGYFSTSNPDEFELYPSLENAQPGTLQILVAKTPKLDATAFPRQIQSKYYDALVEGFLARMYIHPNKPYSAPQLGMDMRHKFRRRIAYYAAQAKQGYIDAPSWRFPRGWAPRRLSDGV